MLPSLIPTEKIQIYWSLYGLVKDVFDIIMGKSNEITGNKTCKSVLHVRVYTYTLTCYIS